MKYTLQAIAYTVKNFIFLLPFVVLPALFLSASTDQEAIFCLIETLFSGKPSGLHFQHVFHGISILNFSSWGATFSGLLAVVSTVLCAAVLMAMLEKHMRIGKRTFNGIFSKLNDNLLPTCGYVLLLLIIYEIWTLLTAALVYALSLIPFVALAYVLMGVAYLAMHVLLLYAVGLIYLWLPCMQLTGFKAADALYYSYQISESSKWHILLGQLFSLLVVEAAIFVFALYAQNSVVFTVLTAVFYGIVMMIYCVRMQVVYFDLDNIERADLTYYYQR